MNKQIAEFIGTFTLVLFGCGSAVIAGADIGLTGISFAFGLALIGMAYAIGPVSGCHINPAVSLGAWAAGRMSMPEAIKYIIAQVAGAVVAALVLLLIMSGKADYSVAENGLGQNGWGAGYLGEYSMISALVFEVVATFLFMVVILGATGVLLRLVCCSKQANLTQLHKLMTCRAARSPKVRQSRWRMIWAYPTMSGARP